MSARSTNYLVLALAVALAGACSEDKGVKENTDPVDGTEDESNDEAAADDDEDVAAPTDEDESTPPPDTSKKDAGKPPVIDAGSKPAPTDAKVADTGATGSTTDTGVASTGDGGTVKPPVTGDGMCCDDGNCLCHGDVPSALTAEKGPYATKSYTVPEGCIYYPDGADAKPPFAAVTFSHGFGGTGGCSASSFQGGGWAPLYASWGIVAMTINTGSGDQPNVRGQKLLKGIAAFKAENMKSGSPLEGKLAGRYGTSGFSMGGGGTSLASVTDKTLLTSVAVMPWGPARSGVQTPTLIICGSSDGTAPCGSHGNPLYAGIMDPVPKMRVQVSSGHQGQPSVDSGKSGKYGLAFQKVFLEGDTRWRPLLVAAPSEATNIK